MPNFQTDLPGWMMISQIVLGDVFPCWIMDHEKDPTSSFDWISLEYVGFSNCVDL
jgi:hypothetical protein